MRPALLTSDVHLSPEHGRTTSRALARLMGETSNADVYLVGDIFDLSQTPHLDHPSSTIRRILTTHVDWVQACRRHLAQGGRLCFVAGNHDAELATPEVAATLRDALEPPDERQLSVVPWFCRHGSAHVEHGHVYDPDCAPNHPLSPPSAESEGLGTALVRRFLVPSGALEFAHAHELTPRSGLRLAAKKWGLRTPTHVLGYFRTAAKLCVESMTHGPLHEAARHAGGQELALHAQRTGLSVNTLEALLALAPRPTHHDFRDTFLRLYFDRILAGGGAGLGASLLAASVALPPLLVPGAAAATVGLGYLLASGARQQRHKEGPVSALAAAAERIRGLTECSLVVFGHSHVPSEQPGYVNLGSFAFARTGRPYLLLDSSGRAEVKRLTG